MIISDFSKEGDEHYISASHPFDDYLIAFVVNSKRRKKRFWTWIRRLLNHLESRAKTIILRHHNVTIDETWLRQCHLNSVRIRQHYWKNNVNQSGIEGDLAISIVKDLVQESIEVALVPIRDVNRFNMYRNSILAHEHGRYMSSSTQTYRDDILMVLRRCQI